MQRDDCLFCKIIRGEIPSSKVYEDEYVYAFDDVSPQMPVHTLIVPKNHYDNIAAGIPVEELGHLFAAVEKVADIKGVREQGFRTLVNTGVHAGQTVFHLHVHVLGGAPMNSGDPSL